jgi:hypothetical protein
MLIIVIVQVEDKILFCNFWNENSSFDKNSPRKKRTLVWTRGYFANGCGNFSHTEGGPDDTILI